MSKLSRSTSENYFPITNPQGTTSVLGLELTDLGKTL